jgi:hypothetical protein
VPASATIDVANVKNVLTTLRKVEPELSKTFRAEAQTLAQPAIDAVRARYETVPLSGMARKWDDRGRQVFPFNVAKAKRGVRLQFDTRRNAVGVLKIQQRDPAAAIFETAGRRDINKLQFSLDAESNRGWALIQPGRTRIIGREVYKQARRGVTDNLKRLILDVSRKIESDL